MRMCFCLLLLTFFIAAPAHAASFDCAKARAADERAVCASRALSEMDVEMAVRGEMGEAQRACLSERRRCSSDTACLTRAYRARIVTLKEQYERLKERGPF